MRVDILGTGSVGLGIAASLIHCGADVTILTRGTSLVALQSGGIRVTGLLGEYALAPRDFKVKNVADATPAADLLIVATKTYAVAPALTALLPALKLAVKKPALLLLQNGWGSADEAKAIMPQGTALFSASVMVGLERLGPNDVRINAFGDVVRAGSLFKDDVRILAPLFEQTVKSLIPFAPEPEIEDFLLTKLLYNICLNPLGALLRCRYGELLADTHALGLMWEIAQEGLNSLKVARHFTRFSSGEAYVRDELVGKWLPKVAAHRSSMLQDLETGRPTEIHYLNGAIAALGRAHNIPTRSNDMIIALIQAGEKRKS